MTSSCDHDAVDHDDTTETTRASTLADGAPGTVEARGPEVHLEDAPLFVVELEQRAAKGIHVAGGERPMRGGEVRVAHRIAHRGVQAGVSGGGLMMKLPRSQDYRHETSIAGIVALTAADAVLQAMLARVARRDLHLPMDEGLLDESVTFESLRPPPAIADTGRTIGFALME